MPIIYCLIGLPFAGKTTFAKMLHEKFGWRIISFDAELGHLSFAEKFKLSYAEASTIVFGRLKQALASQKSVIFDAMNLTSADRNTVAEIAVKHGYTIQFVYLRVPHAILLHRKDTSNDHEKVPEPNFVAALSSFEEPLAKTTICIDPAQSTTMLQSFSNSLRSPSGK